MPSAKLGTPDLSTFESRIKFLNHPPEWHEEHRLQLKRERQLAEFHAWATSWSNGVHAARERTQVGIERVYQHLRFGWDNWFNMVANAAAYYMVEADEDFEDEDFADWLDSRECAL